MEERYIALIQEHEGIIHKVIGLYVDFDEDKKDMYQEILLQAWKSFGNFRGDSTFSTWLYRICLNIALTFSKRQKAKQKADEVLLNSQQESVSDPSIGESHEMLYQIIKRLNEVDRMIMTLHLDGYKNPEIASISGMTINNVNVKIHRLKTNIIAQLKKYEDGHI